jgi:hypothetical protein
MQKKPEKNKSKPGWETFAKQALALGSTTFWKKKLKKNK